MLDYLTELRRGLTARAGGVPVWLWTLDGYALAEHVPGLALFVSWAAFLVLFGLPLLVVRRRSATVKRALTHGRAVVEGGFDVPRA